MMGVEIQNKIINEMLTGTANDMRLIAAKLIPYMMMKGHVEDICHFNDFTDDVAGLIESYTSNDNKNHFVAPTVLDDHIDNFLFNLGMCLCRMYDDICENCPDQATCQRSGNPKRDIDHKIVPITNMKPVLESSQPSIKTLDLHRITDFVEMFCERYSRLASKNNVIELKKKILKHITDIWTNEYTVLEKGIKILEELLEFLRVLDAEFKINTECNDTDEFL